MKKSLINLFALLVILSNAQSQDLNLKNKKYLCISAGIGADYVNVPDVVDYITSISGKKINEFDGALELWISPELKIDKNTSVKLEYSYITKQYNVEETSTGASLIYNFTYQIHSPTLSIDHLVFQEKEIYIIKLGAGIGFVKGYFKQFLPISLKEINYTSNGGIFKLEAIFSSRLDGKVYVHLSTDLKLSLTSEARDEDGNKLIIRIPFGEDRNLRLNFFGLAIRAGFSYYF